VYDWPGGNRMSAELKQIQQFSTKDDHAQFIHDVFHGLSGEKKHLSFKYFYDTKGSYLFNLITKQADYYLTQCELEIIDHYKEVISHRLNSHSFNLIELGPGEGIKTRLLIDQFLKDGHDFTYFTIDISEKYLSQIVKKFNKELAHLKLIALNADYFNGLKWLSEQSTKPNLVLFLGSSIGNFTPRSTNVFLKGIWNDLHDGDYCLIGFDLRKDMEILLKAYNDSKGLTREFNLNLLARINRELGGHFNKDHFEHYAVYNVYNGAMESYLISSQDDDVSIEALNQSFHFDAYEPLHLEYSYKYNLAQIAEHATLNGFKVVDNYFDEKRFFVDSLWQVVK
jgi:L-histidine Nalpha-methyltransferase